MLVMGASLASDIFQRRVVNRVADVQPRSPNLYIDNILAALKHSFGEDIQCLDQIFERLGEAVIQININKSALCQKELEYVGFWVTTKG